MKLDSFMLNNNREEFFCHEALREAPEAVYMSSTPSPDAEILSWQPCSCAGACCDTIDIRAPRKCWATLGTSEFRTDVPMGGP
jgi:hypothetical protein